MAGTYRKNSDIERNHEENIVGIIELSPGIVFCYYRWLPYVGSYLHRKLAAKASAKVGAKVPANA